MSQTRLVGVEAELDEVVAAAERAELHRARLPTRPCTLSVSVGELLPERASAAAASTRPRRARRSRPARAPRCRCGCAWRLSGRSLAREVGPHRGHAAADVDADRGRARPRPSWR